MSIRPRKAFQLYQLGLIFSFMFALLGFSYNVWRMEISEANSNTRTACFELLLKLSELEQLIYSAYYDQDEVAGNPRRGWVLVGLIKDLSLLTPEPVSQAALQLHGTWSEHWPTLSTSRSSADALSMAIDEVREPIKQVLRQLE